MPKQGPASIHFRLTVAFSICRTDPRRAARTDQRSGIPVRNCVRLKRTLTLVLIFEQGLHPCPILDAHIAGEIAFGVPDLRAETTLLEPTSGICPTQPHGLGIGFEPRESGMAKNLRGKHTVDRLGESVFSQVARQRFSVKVRLRSVGF
jgi:hypothetical protein